MAINMLSDSSSLKKLHISPQEELLHIHLRIEAMFHMLLRVDLIEYPIAELYEYLCVISDLFDQAVSLCKQILSDANECVKEDNMSG